MSANFLKNGNKVYLYMNTIWKRHSISKSLVPTITRPHFHHSKATYSGFPQRNNKEMDFSWISNSRIIRWYMNMLKTRPILTKSITSGLIYTAADLSSQTLTRSSSEAYDLLRTLRMAGIGMLIVGPSLHFWFNFVSRLYPNRDLISTFKKMFMGKTIFGPILTVVFFTVNAVLQGESGSELVARLKRDLMPTLINGVMYWCVSDFIIFRFIPLHLQPLVSNSLSYIWNIYMTYMASLEKEDTK